MLLLFQDYFVLWEVCYCMRTIALSSLKGGVAKTALTIMLGSMLAKEGKMVLLIDCDPQGNTSSIIGGLDDVDYEYATIADIFEAALREKDISPADIVQKELISRLPMLDLLPANISLTATEMRLVSFNSRERILSDYIEAHEQFFSKYDYIFFDLNPSLNTINQAALYASDKILIPTDVGMSSFRGIRLFIDMWDGMCRRMRIPNNIAGIIVTRYDKRIKLSSNFISFLKANDDIAGLVMDEFIPESVKIREADVKGEPLPIYNTKNEGYYALERLVNELKQKEVI